MKRRPPRSTQSRSSAASDVYKRQDLHIAGGRLIEGPPPPDSIHGRLDASGMFAIPGLIDMHVHMTSDPTGRAVGQWSNLTTTIEVLTAVDNLALALATGVTTVRDLGTRGRLGYDIQAAWVRGSFVGARPVVAGPVITSIGGHGSWLGVESEGMHHIPSLVRKNVADGSRVIKLMMSSAARTIELRPEEVAAAVRPTEALLEAARNPESVRDADGWLTVTVGGAEVSRTRWHPAESEPRWGLLRARRCAAHLCARPTGCDRLPSCNPVRPGRTYTDK